MGVQKRMDRSEFLEALLQIMERKDHWAWPLFTSGKVDKSRLHLHLEQEYEVYIRDFPVLIGKAYVQCPIPVVRQELVENLYEEETGGLHAGRPHPELFLLYPEGLGMDLDRFQNVELLPEARKYRDLLHESCGNMGWAIGAAVSTLFVEGTKHDRSVLDPTQPARPAPPLEEHPLVKFYGLDLSFLALTKAHRGVEGEHREAAWRILLGHVDEADRQPVVATMGEVLTHWLAYRDAVASACGLVRP